MSFSALRRPFVVLDVAHRISNVVHDFVNPSKIVRAYSAYLRVANGAVMQAKTSVSDYRDNDEPSPTQRHLSVALERSQAKLVVVRIGSKPTKLKPGLY